MHHVNGDVDTIAFALPSRLKRVIRKPNGWLLWTETNDFVLGTYFMCYDNGYMERVTVRIDQGDEVVRVRPATAQLTKGIE